MANNHSETERRLWEAADEFRANSELKSSEYSTPVLGLIFLRYADHRFTLAEKELKGKGSRRRKIGKEDYQAKGVMYLPKKARFSHLLALPEGENINSRKLPLAFLAYGQFGVNNHAHILQGKAPVSTEFLLTTLTDTDVSRT